MPEISDWGKGPFAFLGSIPAFTQGDYEKGVQGLVNSGGFLAFAAYRYKGNTQNQDAFKVETKILWYGILYIMSLQLLYMKATDTGKEYKAAKADFEAASQSLESAIAEEWGGWTGTAADAYNAQNSLQMARTVSMADLDAEIYDVLAKETGQVKRAVLNLGWEQTGLTCMIPICSLIYKTNPPLSLKTQTTAVMCAVLASIAIVKGTINDSSDNAGTINTTREGYRKEGDSAAASLAELTTNNASQGQVTAAKKTTVGEFDTINTGAAPVTSLAGPVAAPAAESNGPGDAAPVATSAGNAGAGVYSAAATIGAAAGEPSAGKSSSYPIATASQVASRASQASTQAARAANAGPATPPVEEASAAAEGAERAPVGAIAGDGPTEVRSQ
jgi:EspA/EspE family